MEPGAWNLELGYDLYRGTATEASWVRDSLTRRAFPLVSGLVWSGQWSVGGGRWAVGDGLELVLFSDAGEGRRRTLKLTSSMTR